MRTTGLGFSTFLIALGAVLAFAVSVEAEGFNINTIGWILMIVGGVGFLGTMLMASADERTVVERDREVVVDRTG